MLPGTNPLAQAHGGRSAEHRDSRHSSVRRTGTDGVHSGIKRQRSLGRLVPASIRAKGTIVVGTQPDFEPADFTPIGENGVKGFNIDLMDAMAAKLGLKVTYQKVPFDQLLVGVQTGKFDASIAGMTDRKQRQANVDFVDYQVAGTVFMVAKGNPKNITGDANGGCGIKIGGVKGNDDERLVGLMAAACTAEGKPAPELVTFPTGSDKNLALTSVLMPFSGLIWRSR
ncbi:transporter substrate-binding domain-containing protein [Arthrobacter sp. ERGS1:01]|uniref:transporter substrate-binding domain-containing protein n=1 Tax=Arthrobacter sp. ERGS1:01 TaxID=1704044 RepID=UPI0006B47740|nr:transporter substrate-binding domain-containing protein [Arthrobacter sp. ERGS1:01]